MKQLFYATLFLFATGCTGQTADFTTNANTYYHWAKTTVHQAVHVELTGAGLLTLTDARNGVVIGRYKVQTTEREDGVFYCLSAGNNLSGRFYRVKTEIYVDTLLCFVEVWKGGVFHSRYGAPVPVTLNQ